MATRRSFIASLLVSASLPTMTWADAGGPAYLAAAKDPDGSFALFGLTALGAQVFRIPLPARGHAGAAHPVKPEAVAFARRPGTFGLVIDCVSGRVMHQLASPEGRHFSGHGTFSADGAMLYTSETDDVGGAGHIGIWDTQAHYRRVGSFSSGGLGPHEILRLPQCNTLVVANGGIIAALDDDRRKLNLATMAPNLSYLTSDGVVLEQVTLPDALRQNSIRHLAAASDGTVALAMQWEGDPAVMPPLLGLHQRGQALKLAALPEHLAYRLKNYAASVAIGGCGERVAITCPKGGVMVHFDRFGGDPVFLERRDVCGLSAAADGFFVSDGMGGIMHSRGAFLTPLATHEHAWDNHLVKV